MWKSIPYSFHSEIIPIVWDCWPSTWNKLFFALDNLKCKICFVTSKQVSEQINNKRPNLKCFYLAEGIDSSDYSKGLNLLNRELDVYELGRQMETYHAHLVNLNKNELLSGYYHNEYNQDGSLNKLAFDTYPELINNLPRFKVVISFPNCDTNPEYAGEIETLTQRYWESMLCRNVIVGRAPKELIDLIGYNPVVDIDWSDPEYQLIEILNNINLFQNLVDKNYDSAKKMSSWNSRIYQIQNILCSNGYKL